jgi:hypothetical protein
MSFNYKGIEKEQFYEIVDLAINRLETLMERLRNNSVNEDLDALYIQMLFTHHKMMDGFFTTKDFKILEEAERVRKIINELHVMRQNATAM